MGGGGWCRGLRRPPAGPRGPRRCAAQDDVLRRPGQPDGQRSAGVASSRSESVFSRTGRAVEQLLRPGEHDLGEVERGDDGARATPRRSRRRDDLVAVRGGERRAQAGSGEPRLEAAALAAGAVLAAVGADGDVADLARGEVRAAHPAAAGDDAAADAAADLTRTRSSLPCRA